jgi:hypothetical protein
MSFVSEAILTAGSVFADLHYTGICVDNPAKGVVRCIPGLL